MQDDEFEEYESAPPPETPSEPQTAHPLHHETFSLHNPTLNQMQEPPLTPLYSQMTNNPSEQSKEQERQNDQGAFKPPLIKMESESVVPIDEYKLDFTKSNSHHSLPKPPLNHELDFLSFDQHQPQIEVPQINQAQPQFSLNLPNQNEVQKGQKESFDFGLGISDTTKPIETKQSSHHNDLFWDAQITEDKPEDTNGNNVIHEGNRKESEDFVFQSQQPQQNPFQQPQKGSQVKGEQKEETLIFQGSENNNLGYNPPQIVQQAQNQKKQEQIQLQYQNLVEEKAEPEEEFQKATTPRKQSQDFVFQEVEPQRKGEQTDFPTSQPLQVQHQSYMPPSFNPLSEATQDPYFSSIKKQNIQLGQQFQTKIKANQSSKEFKEEPVYKQVALEDEDDQFGEFQETVEVEQGIGGGNNLGERREEYTVEEQGQTPVEIDANRAPYDINISTKEKELNDFVASLPNYKFLLLEAFKTV